MTNANVFVRRVIQVYVSWPSQVFLYLSVFIIATGTALLLDMYLGVRPEVVVLYVTAFVLVMLLGGPPSFVALRSRRVASSQTRSESKHEPESWFLTAIPATNIEERAKALINEWEQRTDVLAPFRDRMLTEFTDRQLALLVFQILWDFEMRLKDEAYQMAKTRRISSDEYVRGFDECVTYVIWLFLTEFTELSKQPTEKTNLSSDTVREERNRW